MSKIDIDIIKREAEVEFIEETEEAIRAELIKLLRKISSTEQLLDGYKLEYETRVEELKAKYGG